VSELVKTSELRVEPERLNALLDTLAASYEDPEEVKSYYRSRADLMQNLRDMAAEERVVDFVLDNANVVDVPTAFADVVKPAQ